MANNNFFKVLLGLAAGLAVIMYFNPPSSPCTAQVLSYSEAFEKLKKPFSTSLEECKQHPEPGGCLKFFDILDKIESHFKEVSTRECLVELRKDKPTHTWITLAMEVYTLLAWGSKPPPSYVYRNGWLDLTQIVEFCRLRKHMDDIYGPEEWSQFVSNMTSDLPGAQDLNATDVWNRSLMSDPCKYPL